MSVAPMEITKTLDSEGKRGVAIFKTAISSVKATGKTEQSARYEVAGKGSLTSLTIFSRPFTPVLETGSKPAKTDTPSKEMIDELTAWAQSRGIPEDAVWGIAKKLLREGQRVNRDLYTKAMDKFADEVADKVTSEFVGYAIDKLFNTFR